MKKLFVRVLIFLVIILSFIVAFITTFLFGSNWLPNSAFTLAIFPSIFAVFILSIFFIRSKHSGKWRIADIILSCLAFLIFTSISLALLGFFSAKSEFKSNKSGSTFIKSDKVSIYYNQSTKAKVNSPYIIVLHGGPGSGSYSLRAAICDSIEQDFNMIYFDQRGTGRSSWANSFTLDDYINDMEILRKSLNIDSWYLFSISWGTVLANEYAIRYPERVKGIINWGGLISSQTESKEMIRHILSYYESKNENKEITFWKKLLFQDSPYSRFQTFKIVNKVNKIGLKSVYNTNKQVERMHTFRKRAINEWDYKRNELGANLWVTLTTFMQLKLENYDFSPKLKSIKQPYLFLAGRHDPQMNLEELNRYKESMANASLKVIENSGHLFDNPHDMISEIKIFIKTDTTRQNLIK